MRFCSSLNSPEEKSQTQGRAVPAPLARKRMEGPRVRGRLSRSRGETCSYSRRAAGFSPTSPHPRQGTPPVAASCGEVAMEEHRSTSNGAGPSRTAMSDARRKESLRLASNPSAATATGGVPRLEMGGSGEEQWHGESWKGSSPDTSSPPAYSLSLDRKSVV